MYWRIFSLQDMGKHGKTSQNGTVNGKPDTENGKHGI
jgi:hypothetical protein